MGHKTFKMIRALNFITVRGCGSGDNNNDGGSTTVPPDVPDCDIRIAAEGVTGKSASDLIGLCMLDGDDDYMTAGTVCLPKTQDGEPLDDTDDGTIEAAKWVCHEFSLDTEEYAEGGGQCEYYHEGDFKDRFGFKGDSWKRTIIVPGDFAENMCPLAKNKKLGTDTPCVYSSDGGYEAGLFAGRDMKCAKDAKAVECEKRTPSGDNAAAIVATCLESDDYMETGFACLPVKADQNSTINAGDFKCTYIPVDTTNYAKAGGECENYHEGDFKDRFGFEGDGGSGGDGNHWKRRVLVPKEFAEKMCPLALDLSGNPCVIVNSNNQYEAGLFANREMNCMESTP